MAAAQDPSIFDAGAENRPGLTFTPDGKRAFWTEWDGTWGSKRTQRVIYTAELRDETWTKPVPAAFSQQYSDDNPYVSPDGRWLYFVSGDESEMIFEASSRSTNVSESGDLYYSWRTPAGWTVSVPIRDLWR